MYCQKLQLKQYCKKVEKKTTQKKQKQKQTKKNNNNDFIAFARSQIWYCIKHKTVYKWLGSASAFHDSILQDMFKSWQDDSIVAFITMQLYVFLHEMVLNTSPRWLESVDY